MLSPSMTGAVKPSLFEAFSVATGTFTVADPVPETWVFARSTVSFGSPLGSVDANTLLATVTLSLFVARLPGFWLIRFGSVGLPVGSFPPGRNSFRSPLSCAMLSSSGLPGSGARPESGLGLGSVALSSAALSLSYVAFSLSVVASAWAGVIDPAPANKMAEVIATAPTLFMATDCRILAPNVRLGAPGCMSGLLALRLVEHRQPGT